MIRAMIVDDEIAVIGNCADLLLEIRGVKTVAKFTNPFETLEQVSGL